ncbi:hypothetical protein DQ04_10171000 [Trypanosoma grayi]|uniref:hypothetical protein n=1 Tax=Trypanosoma grayi TaxID=71804 RepID=UPI0004F45C5E|nr:hypothetical protein DQ04_10171000 [Trypanosoma grayi]KEG07324.1 hypothetical protein DQ04_10171000 [Trypanosoma grayi]
MDFASNRTASVAGANKHVGVSSIHVTEYVMIPPFYIVLAASLSYCLCNAAFNYITSSRSKISRTVEKWGRLLWLTRRFLIVKSDVGDDATKTENPGRICDESSLLLSRNRVSTDYTDNAVFFQGMTHPETLADASPVVPASVVNEALLDSLHCVRLEAQRMVFVYNPTYMIIATAKSLTMLVVLQYHFDQKGGWDRLVVCSAANLMSGLLTPILEYGAGLLLPLDRDHREKAVAVEAEEPKDSVLIVEILVRIGRLELDDLETVLIQGSTFIVFGAVLLPAAIVFCVVGFAAFMWVFAPFWLCYMLVRYLYYRCGGVAAQRAAGRPQDVLLTPAGEFAKAALLKVLTLFLLQWAVQCSFLFGLVLLQGGWYSEALQLEAEHQLWGSYNLAKMDKFQWLCVVSQLFF